MVTENSEIASFARKGIGKGILGIEAAWYGRLTLGSSSALPCSGTGSVHNAFEGAEIKGLRNHFL